MDIGGLRVRRHTALENFTRRAISQVVESGEDVRFEPMSRVDRKIVHDVVAESEGVDSYSEGSDPVRYIVISGSAEGD